MKKCLIFLISVLMFLFTGCGSSNSEGTAYTEVNTQEGITLSLKEDTLKSSTGTFILTNDTKEAVSYGAKEYHFEQMKDGQWQEFAGTAQANWSEEEVALESGASTELSYNWKTFCGNTTKGEQYRLIIFVNESPVAVEFTGA
ncbi:immunoglobulin-like domain-containing protein [Anaerotignum propionicum]|jgi:hypothetical protein|uniref:immunoglobulin-like domain-containing protein n=1 Tax=Anaerotignum propionicum TaxID=28446 RepID=UPI00289AE0FC|nr:immunoglobulin-like domain-containing protein [Anaerotignum propionicum]